MAEEQHAIRKLFSYDSERDLSKCLVSDTCRKHVKPMKGNHLGNLTAHVKRCHKREFDEAFMEVDVQGAATKRRRVDLERAEKDHKLTVLYSKRRLITACVELVTVNGRPFSIIEDSGFKKLIEPFIEALQKTGVTVAINAENIRETIPLEAARIRESLRTELENQIISLKVDCAKRLNRSMLGINVQFVKNGKIHLRTLAMREVTAKHTGEHLKEMMTSVLRNYSISLKHIYTITVDNGANIVRSAALIIRDQEFQTNDPFEMDETIDQVICGSSHEEILLQALENWDSIATENREMPVVTKIVRCMAHTLQLAIEEALKESENASCLTVIKAARDVCKELRTTNMLILLKREGKKYPIIDNDTRWHSKADMLERLLELKDFCEMNMAEYQNLWLAESDWEAISSILASLTPARVATKTMQLEQLTPGSFPFLMILTLIITNC
jgi:hypothetical protein